LQQRAIYDKRYDDGSYDRRSAVRVLSAERRVLSEAVARFLVSTPKIDQLSLFDFGYGTGRVSNEFAAAFPAAVPEFSGDLRIIAFDISAAGLHKASISLVEEHQFHVLRPLVLDRTATSGYNAGSVTRLSNGMSVTVVFVHGAEHEDPKAVRCLVEEVNEGRPISITTSWYSGIAHIPTAARRADFFEMLADLTDARGELLIAPSVSGDLVKLQAVWAERLRRGDVGGYPIEGPGDVIYETELGQENFYHVFGEDLEELLRANTAPHQQAWLEAIRLPDPEFLSEACEQNNYRRVQEFNRRVGRRSWRPEDYRQVHTAVAIRSGSPGEPILSATGG